jgi:hypothetical protein
MPKPTYSGQVKRGNRDMLHFGTRLGPFCGREWKPGTVQPDSSIPVRGSGNCRECVDLISGRLTRGPQGLSVLMRL